MSVNLDGLNATPAEIAALDQVLAEADLADPPDDDLQEDPMTVDLSSPQAEDRLAALAGTFRSEGHAEYAQAVDHFLAGSINEVTLAHILPPGQLEDIELALEMDELGDFSPQEIAAPSGMTPRRLDLARQLTAELASTGDPADIELAARAYAEIGGVPHDAVLDLGNRLDAQLDLSQAAYAGDAQAARSARGARALSAEERLANSLDRIGRGTYQPRPTDLASPSASEAARQLAQARWGVSQPGPVTGQPNCSGSDDFGMCRGRYHDASCGSLASTDIAEGLREAGAYRRLASLPFETANGVWQDRSGGLMTLADHVEAATGERLRRDSVFESGGARRDVAAPGLDARYGDPDEPGRPSTAFPDDTAAVAGAVRAQMGIPKRDAAAERDRYTERRLAGALSQALSGRGLARQPDFDMTARRQDIREAYGPPQPVQFGEGPVNGSLASYEAG
jgi:hypothetical protein